MSVRQRSSQLCRLFLFPLTLMNRHLLLEHQDVFREPMRPVTHYLAGIGRERALAGMVGLLYYLSSAAAAQRDYADDFEQVFSEESRPFAELVYRQMEQLARQTGSKVNFLHIKTALQLFCYCYELPDEAPTQTTAELQRSIFQACLVLNHAYIAEQGRATDEAKRLLPDQELAALSLGSTFSDAELVNHSLPGVTVAQLLKSVRFFEFLTAAPRFAPLLALFLAHFGCASWPEFLRRLGGLFRPIVQADKSRLIVVEVPPGTDHEASCAFLRHFCLPTRQPLDKEDFTSLRATPLWEHEPGSFVLVLPVLVLEMLHKGLYFQFSRLNQLLPKQQRIKDWRAEYCDYFSEQHLLYQLLDDTFRGRGIALSGSAIKDRWQLAGQGEPDYYFREGRRAIIVESKDVLVQKTARAGHDFASYYAELEKKFYRDGKHPKAALQLLRNVERLLAKQLPFDTAYDAAELRIYPVLVVHDRLYNQPGLNEVVNGWFQHELAKLAQAGQPVQHVQPLVIVDVDTLLFFHEHFRDGRLVFEDVLDDYLAYINFRNGTVRSQAELEERMLRSVHPFSLFLENYAHQWGLAQIPSQMLYNLLPQLNAGLAQEPAADLEQADPTTGLS